MKAVQYDAYCPAREVLRVIADAPMPTPGPREIVVRAHASSVNFIDCAVRSGYGREFLKSRAGIELPIRPGRDVAGVVTAIGAEVQQFRPGDEIYAATLNNANAEFVAIPEDWAAPKPCTLTFTEAASLPYVAQTSWTALVDRAGLNESNAASKRVIIPRAAGGVGSFATQLVKAWGGYVAALCSTRNVELVRSLGADLVIDYTREDPREKLHDFDIAFDTSPTTEATLLDALKVNSDAVYVSIVAPRIRLVDQYGLEEGVRRGDALLADRVSAQAAHGRSYHWCFAQPNSSGLKTVRKLVECGAIRPVIDRTFKLGQIVEAHEYCESGKAQGKIVLEIV